jgi:hypothetical protein
MRWLSLVMAGAVLASHGGVGRVKTLRLNGRESIQMGSPGKVMLGFVRVICADVKARIGRKLEAGDAVRVEWAADRDQQQQKRANQ